MIQSEIDRGISQIKIANQFWEDGIDVGFVAFLLHGKALTPLIHQNPIQNGPVGLSGRYWGNVDPPTSSSDSQDESPPPCHRQVRARRGRGGVIRLDRREHHSRNWRPDDEDDFLRRSRLRQSEDSSEEDPDERRERAWRITERWRYDRDDEPPVGPEGPDEQDRTLVDEYEPK